MTTCNEQTTSVSAIVLAGGYSRRMGTDKAFLSTLGQNHLTMIVDKLSLLSDDVAVIRRHDQVPIETTATVKYDVRPGEGPLAGLEAGLGTAKYEWVICLSVDVPFVRIELLQYLLSLCLGKNKKTQAIIPILEKQIYPMVSVYHTSCVSEIKNMLDRRNRRVLDLVNRLQTRYVLQEEWEHADPEHDSFMMLNTQEDYDEMLRGRLTGGVTG